MSNGISVGTAHRYSLSQPESTIQSQQITPQVFDWESFGYGMLGGFLATAIVGGIVVVLAAPYIAKATAAWGLGKQAYKDVRSLFKR